MSLQEQFFRLEPSRTLKLPGKPSGTRAWNQFSPAKWVAGPITGQFAVDWLLELHFDPNISWLISLIGQQKLKTRTRNRIGRLVNGIVNPKSTRESFVGDLIRRLIPPHRGLSSLSAEQPSGRVIKNSKHAKNCVVDDVFAGAFKVEWVAFGAINYSAFCCFRKLSSLKFNLETPPSLLRVEVESSENA
jgi:hypothetical protein